MRYRTGQSVCKHPLMDHPVALIIAVVVVGLVAVLLRGRFPRT
jgi:hypothetical protein